MALERGEDATGAVTAEMWAKPFSKRKRLVRAVRKAVTRVGSCR